MRSYLILVTALAVIVLLGSVQETVHGLWTLLVVIIGLLAYPQFRKKDFYVVEHIIYDLNFINAPDTYSRPNVRIERGAVLLHGCRRVGFLDYAAAKASFDYQEDLHSGDPMRGTEAIHRLYAVSALGKPVSGLLKDDKYRTQWTLLHSLPHQIMYARRREAREDRVLGIENARAMEAHQQGPDQSPSDS